MSSLCDLLSRFAISKSELARVQLGNVIGAPVATAACCGFVEGI